MWAAGYSQDPQRATCSRVAQQRQAMGRHGPYDVPQRELYSPKIHESIRQMQFKPNFYAKFANRPALPKRSRSISRSRRVRPSSFKDSRESIQRSATGIEERPPIQYAGSSVSIRQPSLSHLQHGAYGRSQFHEERLIDAWDPAIPSRSNSRFSSFAPLDHHRYVAPYHLQVEEDPRFTRGVVPLRQHLPRPNSAYYSYDSSPIQYYPYDTPHVQVHRNDNFVNSTWSGIEDQLEHNSRLASARYLQQAYASNHAFTASTVSPHQGSESAPSMIHAQQQPTPNSKMALDVEYGEEPSRKKRKLASMTALQEGTARSHINPHSDANEVHDLASPIDSIQLKQYSSKPAKRASHQATREHDVGVSSSSSLNGLRHYFIETPPSTYGETHNDTAKCGQADDFSQNKRLSTLAERLNNGGDASDDDAEPMETAMRKSKVHANKTPRQQSRDVGYEPSGCTSQARPRKRFGEQSSSSTLHEQAQHGTTTKVNKDSTQANKMSSPGARVALQTSLNDSPSMMIDSEMITSVTESLQRAPDHFAIASPKASLRPDVDCQKNACFTPPIADITTMSTPSAATEPSPNIRSALGLNSGPAIEAQNDEVNNTNLDANIGASDMLDEMLGFLNGQDWQYDYGSSCAPSSSLTCCHVSDPSVICLDSTQNAAVNDSNTANVADDQLLITSSSHDVPDDRTRRPQSLESNDEIVWLGENRTGPYVAKVEPIDHRSIEQQPSDVHASPVSSLPHSDSNVPKAPIQPVSVPPRAAQQQVEKPQLESRVSLTSHHVPSSGRGDDDATMPPPSSLSAAWPVATPLQQGWTTPCTPALSDLRGVESQNNATPSTMFKGDQTAQFAELPLQNQPITGKKTGRSRSRSRPRSVTPLRRSKTDDAEVLEAWANLEDFKMDVECKERSKKREAELAKIDRQKAALAKRDEKASKAPIARGRKQAQKEPKPTTSAAPRRLKSLEQRAKEAKAMTQKKQERSLPNRSSESSKQQDTSTETKATILRSQPSEPSTPTPAQPKTSRRAPNPSVSDPFIQELIASPSSDRDLNAKFSAWYEYQYLEKERSRPTGLAKPKFAAIAPNEILPDDLLLMKLREAGAPWAEVHSDYCDRTGRSMREDTLRHRHLKLIATINAYLLSGKHVEVAPRKSQNPMRNSSPAETINFDSNGNSSSNKTMKTRANMTNSKGHPTTGGKSIDPEVWAKMWQYSPSPSPPPQPSPRRYRTLSPITERDKVHYVYQAVLREVRLGSGHTFSDAEPVAVSKATSDLGAANEAAGRAFRELPKVAAYAWHSCFIRDGMQHWEGELEEEQKKVDVRVARSIRSFQEGALPESKEGWVRSTVYTIKQQEIVFELIQQVGNSKDSAIEIDDRPDSGKDEDDIIRMRGGDAGLEQKTDAASRSIYDQVDLFGDPSDNEEEQQSSTPSSPAAHPTLAAKRLPGTALNTPTTSHNNTSSESPTTQVAPPSSVATSHESSSEGFERRDLSASCPSTSTAIFTVKDMANREAAKLFTQLRHQLSGRPPRLDDVEREKADMSILLDEMEEADAAFDQRSELVAEGRGKEIRVWVEQAALKGPRNI